jgi:hypothetical protein
VLNVVIGTAWLSRVPTATIPVPARALALAVDVAAPYWSERQVPADRCIDIEKAIEQIPDLPAFNDRAVMLVAQRLSPIAMDEVEMDMVRLIEPIAKRDNHMKQHFVAI